MAHKQQGGVLHAGGVTVPVQPGKQLDGIGNVMMDTILVLPSKDLQCLLDASLRKIDITK